MSYSFRFQQGSWFPCPLDVRMTLSESSRRGIGWMGISICHNGTLRTKTMMSSLCPLDGGQQVPQAPLALNKYNLTQTFEDQLQLSQLWLHGTFLSPNSTTVLPHGMWWWKVVRKGCRALWTSELLGGPCLGGEIKSQPGLAVILLPLSHSHCTQPFVLASPPSCHVHGMLCNLLLMAPPRACQHFHCYLLR